MRGQVAYMLDDHTVTGTTTGGLVAGMIYDVDANGIVWIFVGKFPPETRNSRPSKGNGNARFGHQNGHRAW